MLSRNVARGSEVVKRSVGKRAPLSPSAAKKCLLSLTQFLSMLTEGSKGEKRVLMDILNSICTFSSPLPPCSFFRYTLSLVFTPLYFSFSVGVPQNLTFLLILFHCQSSKKRERSSTRNNPVFKSESRCCQLSQSQGSSLTLSSAAITLLCLKKTRGESFFPSQLSSLFFYCLLQKHFCMLFME